MDRRRDERRRHRPGSALTSIVTTAALAYGTYRLVNWAWEQYCGDGIQDEGQGPDRQNTPQQQHASPSAPRAAAAATGSDTPQRWRMRRQRMTRCREEVFKAVEGFLPTLQRIIEERTSTRSETQAMKALRAERSRSSTPEPSPIKCSSEDEPSPVKGSNPDGDGQQQQHRREQEQELWNKIQIKLITRMLATAYAHTILFLVLTVQVNLLGGRLLVEQLESSGGQLSSLASVGPESVASDRMGDYQASHRFVLLHTYDYFFEHGLLSLINSVERAVSKVLSSNDEEKWDVFDRSSLNLSRERMEELIGAIRAEVENGQGYHSSRGRAPRPPRSLFRFLMPPSAHVETPMEDELAATILDETWDLVESPVMMDAQQDCLTTTFELMRDRHWGNLFVTESGECTTKPLARVIPQLKHTAASFYEVQQQQEEYYGTSMSASSSMRQEPTVNSYCSMMQPLPTVLELADVCF